MGAAPSQRLCLAGRAGTVEGGAPAGGLEKGECTTRKVAGSKNIPYGRRYFENIFARQVHNSQRNRNRLQLLRQSASSGRLLEIGCGQGEFLCMAANHYDVEGVDISTHAVRTLRCPDDFKVRRADIQTTSLPENAFSAVAAFNVLEHLTEPAPVIARIHAALHPGGTLVGSVPYNAALLGRIHTGLTNLFDRTHVSTYRPGRWRSLFEQAGFQRVDFFGEINFGKNACRYLRSPLWPALAFNLMFVCTRDG